ncbi:MAG: pyruvate kinase [Spirochaetia bacterium]
MRKQTKIVATISDRRCDPDFISQLYQEGMNVARLNTAHQSPEDTLQVIQNIRSVSEKIGILIDTKGPEVRTKGIIEDIPVKTGETVRITTGNAEGKAISLSYPGFIQDIPEGAVILIDDGAVALKAVKKSDDTLECTVENDGVIQNKRSVNVPGVHLNVPALSEKDMEYINFAIENDIDFIAHSFVRNKKDLKEIQKVLDAKNSRVKIISKIENREGVENLKEIIKHSAGVMIARGDLGIEIPAEEVPAIQKMIIRMCMKKAKPVITATQMLHTMIENPRPTRAEVSDVANAIFDGTDAVMLSGETAYGKYPLESVRIMARIARKIESEKPKVQDLPLLKMKNKLRNYLAMTAVHASIDLPVTAIVSDVETGHSARVVAAYRGHVPIYAKCGDRRVVRELSLTYGVYPSFMEIPATTDQVVQNSLESLVQTGDLSHEDLVVVLTGTPGCRDGSNIIEINTVRHCLIGKQRNIR